MRILCTNDDGILAYGLECLVRAAEPLGEITVVAPDREQSATSHSLTLHHPVRPIRHAERRYQIDGTPTDCVMLAVQGLMPEPPDFVLSGINHGSNMGEDVLYSGTVSAAMEATVFGIPAVALSYTGRGDVEHLEAYGPLLERLLARILAQDGFPRETLLNVNLPPIPADQVKGVKVTRLGRRVFSDSFTRGTDPSGRPYFWIGGGRVEWAPAEGTDNHAVENGYVSVTPLHLDLTNHALIADVAAWGLTA